MSKRRLSDQQRQRIQQNQQASLDKLEQADLDFPFDDELGPEQEGLLITHYGATVEVEDGHGQRHRCVLRQNLDALVVGDRVVWRADQEGSGVVLAYMPRHSVLVRPSRHGGLKPIAANVDTMAIVAANRPAFSEELLDRYLVAAELLNIRPLILFNKVDLLKEEEREAFSRRLQVYRDIGFDVLMLSCHMEDGLEQLQHALNKKTVVFVGQSGVGKSSLVQALLPMKDIKVGDISHQGLGRHTTSAARLYHLSEGGQLIDSPGVREFGLWHISEEELFNGFKEFKEYRGKCQFRNCHHDKELGCALQAAVNDDKLSKLRFNNFKKLLNSLD